MRIVAGFLVHEVRGGDYGAARLRRHFEQPLDPRIVVDAVVDDDLRRSYFARDGLDPVRNLLLDVTL
ncbi:MAG TPA: hypothetical protein VMA30_04350 [Xanthobacteraceae bacterium]|nr:hypothetical protein [Xanthobacteraceae bacterium]